MLRMRPEDKAPLVKWPSGEQHLHYMRRGPSYRFSYYWKLSTRSELCGTPRCRKVLILPIEEGTSQ